jgi:signal peptidase II
MKTQKTIRLLLLLAIIVSNIGCDRISKATVRDEIAINETVKFLNNHFTITHVENTGAFLSLGNSLFPAARIMLLIILPLLVIAGVFYFLLVKNNLSQWALLGLGFIIGGAIGNLYDRIVYGSVTDFVHIKFGIFQTGIFNMADVSIMTGMFIILSRSFFSNKKTVAHAR